MNDAIEIKPSFGGIGRSVAVFQQNSTQYNQSGVTYNSASVQYGGADVKSDLGPNNDRSIDIKPNNYQPILL